MRGQKTQKATLRISKKIMSTNSLVGTWATDLGAGELVRVKARGGLLSFSRHVEMDGTDLGLHVLRSHAG